MHTGEGLQRKGWGRDLRQDQISWGRDDSTSQDQMEQLVRLLRQPWQSHSNAALQLGADDYSTPPPCPLRQLETGRGQGFKPGRKSIQPKPFWRAEGLFTGHVWSQQGQRMLPCQAAPALCRPEQGAGYASTDSDVREQSQHRKGHGEQLWNDKRFQSLLTKANLGFNLAGKGFHHFPPKLHCFALIPENKLWVIFSL